MREQVYNSTPISSVFAIQDARSSPISAYVIFARCREPPDSPYPLLSGTAPAAGVMLGASCCVSGVSEGSQGPHGQPFAECELEWLIYAFYAEKKRLVLGGLKTRKQNKHIFWFGGCGCHEKINIIGWFLVSTPTVTHWNRKSTVYIFSH